MDTPTIPSSPAESVTGETTDREQLHRIVNALTLLGAAIPDCHTVSIATLPNYIGVSFHCDTEARTYALAEAFGVRLEYCEPTADRQHWLRGSGTLGETHVQVFGPHLEAKDADPLNDVDVGAALVAAEEAVRP